MPMPRAQAGRCLLLRAGHTHEVDCWARTTRTQALNSLIMHDRCNYATQASQHSQYMLLLKDPFKTFNNIAIKG